MESKNTKQTNKCNKIETITDVETKLVVTREERGGVIGEIRQGKTNTVCFHLYVESEKQINKYNQTETGSQIQRTN